MVGCIVMNKFNHIINLVCKFQSCFLKRYVNIYILYSYIQNRGRREETQSHGSLLSGDQSEQGLPYPNT